MERITLFVPDELKKKLDEFPEVNWSEVSRAGLKKKVEQLKRFEEFISRGEL